jgi:hypothetical protein
LHVPVSAAIASRNLENHRSQQGSAFQVGLNQSIMRKQSHAEASRKTTIATALPCCMNGKSLKYNGNVLFGKHTNTLHTSVQALSSEQETIMMFKRSTLLFGKHERTCWQHA